MIPPINNFLLFTPLVKHGGRSAPVEREEVKEEESQPRWYKRLWKRLPLFMRIILTIMFIIYCVIALLFLLSAFVDFMNYMAREHSDIYPLVYLTCIPTVIALLIGVPLYYWLKD